MAGRTTEPLSESAARRQLADHIQQVVAQLRDGCGNADCSTSTCFTFRQKTSGVPLRRYNTLAATSIALASTSLLFQKCPHLKSTKPHPLEVHQIDQKSLVQRVHTTNAFRTLLACASSSSNGQRSATNEEHDPRISRHEGANAELSDHILCTDSRTDQLTDLSNDITPDCVVIDKAYMTSSDFDDVLRALTQMNGDPSGRLKARIMIYIEHVFRSPDRLGTSFVESLDLLWINGAAAQLTQHDRLCSQLGQYIRTAGPRLFNRLRQCLLEASRRDGLPDEEFVNIIVICLLALSHAAYGAEATMLFKDMGETSGSRSHHGHSLLIDDFALGLGEVCAVVLVKTAREGRISQVPPSSNPSHRDPLKRIAQLDPALATAMMFPLCTVLHTIVLSHWNGSFCINSSSIEGQALEALSFIEDLVSAEQTPKSHHYLARMAHSFDLEKACSDWLWTRRSHNTRHILSHHVIFSTSDQIKSFRICCYLRMRQSYIRAEFTEKARERINFLLKDQDNVYLDRRLKIEQCHYLVLKISRGRIMEDMFNQLWQRERRELLRPLRIHLGDDNIEVGYDYGGVQAEIFNLLCQRLCDEASSLFVTDPETNLAWFRPGSLEPLFRYELLGIIIGLAVYNGVTLRLSFPLALYAKLMGKKVDEAYLADGWPSLVKGFRQLRDYDGEVGDMSLEHVYSLDANGIVLDIDMMSHEWQVDPMSGLHQERLRVNVLGTRNDEHSGVLNGPSDDTSTSVNSQTSERKNGKARSDGGVASVDDLDWPGWSFASTTRPATAVTSTNLETYITSLTAWTLDLSIRPQFLNFARGFYRVIDHPSISVLSPRSFQELVEGSHKIDPAALRTAATYEGWSTSDKQIDWFWSIVEGYDQASLQRLLEFVTACRRMPGGDPRRLTFVIAKQFAPDDLASSPAGPSLLPGSSTCFGRLYLPQYWSREVLREKLDLALEHSVGFGQA